MNETKAVTGRDPKWGSVFDTGTLPMATQVTNPNPVGVRDYLVGKGYKVDWRDGKIYVGKNSADKILSTPHPAFKNNNGRFEATESDIIKQMNAIGQFANEGYTGSWSGTNGRLAMVHPEEFILNKDTVSNMLQGNLSKILPSTGLSGTSNFNDGGVNLTIDNLINIEGNATKDILPQLESLANKASEKVMEKINQARNKRGLGRDLRFNN
jgi:hypothetical protein